MRSLRKVIKSHQSNEDIVHYQFSDNLQEINHQKQLKKEQELKDGNEHPAEDESEKIVNASIKMAEDILNVARQEAQKIKQDAYQSGYEEGKKAGREDGYWQAYNESSLKFSEDREKALKEVENCLSEMENTKKEVLNKYLEDLKDISVSIAEKVMHISLKTSGDIIKRMIMAATEKLKKTEWAKIYISKYDADLTMQGDAQLLNSLSYLSDNIKIIIMDKEESGTCIIELPKEIIDISVDVQMENIKEILNNAQL